VVLNPNENPAYEFDQYRMFPGDKTSSQETPRDISVQTCLDVNSDITREEYYCLALYYDLDADDEYYLTALLLKYNSLLKNYCRHGNVVIEDNRYFEAVHHDPDIPCEAYDEEHDYTITIV
jgi:hypothetical protein